MDNETHSDIKFQAHFKLLIQFKDKIIFEGELVKNGIIFYMEENQPASSDGIRYFLLDINRAEIDEILNKYEIIATEI